MVARIAAKGKPAKRSGKPVKRANTDSKPNPVGRPRAYDPAMLDEVLLSAASGATWDAIAEACGISVSAAKDWCDPESPTFNAQFLSAVTRAKDKADNLMLSSLYTSGVGYEYTEEELDKAGRIRTLKRYKRDTGAAKSWLANRIGWRGETQRVEADDPLLGLLAAMRGDDDPPAVP